ncbi:MAG: hypothetical protein M1829_002469 [Trizodia sp. TS-e1964]|nr:MAG: hypothetical protein M1829_002469 [Trizodia sp. TS-e1964]
MSEGAPADASTSNGPPGPLGGGRMNAKNNDASSQGPSGPPTASPSEGDKGAPEEGSTNKRRKVNHACVYCRRSDRPCARCVRRSIAHLCRDELREPAKKAKPERDSGNEAEASPQQRLASPAKSMSNSIVPRSDQPELDAQLGLEAPSTSQKASKTASHPSPTAPTSSTPLPAPVYGALEQALDADRQISVGPNSWDFGSQNQFQEMHNLHPNFMFNAREVNSEYIMLNNFLNNSLMDEGVLFPNDDGTAPFYSDPSRHNTANPGASSIGMSSLSTMQPPRLLQPTSSPGNLALSRPASTKPSDKAHETYYLTAADPSGNDAPEERMDRLLQAKMVAGLLRPFNYAKGYARLNIYMEQNMKPSSRQKILLELHKFRPKFRERMQRLTDIELVRVEMWFERSLMEYDRVFASMAIPACCWRRTGEIFRGNKEMAELIHVPIDNLKDGKLAIHEILEEDSVTMYWEKFGEIAFDNTQKAMLTSCHLKTPDVKSKDPTIHCCFSFTIRRDTYDM